MKPAKKSARDRLLAQPCKVCVVDGRCINGKVVWWSTQGRHEEPCHCSCHAILGPRAAKRGGR